MKRLWKLCLSILILLVWLMGSYSHGNATWMTITLTPWWNVVSTPALLSSVWFSNWWNGISFLKLENGQRISVIPNTETFTPLEWFLVKNLNDSDVQMVLTYRSTTPSEDMLSKSVGRWRNLLWITTINNPFYSIWSTLHLDFTKNTTSNLLNSINTDYIAKNWAVEYPEIWEAYWVFLTSNNWLYWWSNNRYWNEKNLFNKNDYQENIWVTPWSYNIPLLKWTITTSEPLSFKNQWFYIEISWANAYEDIAWYEAWWIIYDIVVKVWSCERHIDKYKFSYQTDALWYKKIEIPLFEDCNYISAWTYDIAVLVWINWEYATNFKTGMKITMNPINRHSFNGWVINGEIKSSTIEISHNNLPNLTVESSTTQTGIEITSWMTDFVLWSGILYTNESWIIANVLLDFDTFNNMVLRYKMNVDMYINWELINTTWYKNMSIKYEIPLSQNVNTVVEFRWNFTSTFTGSFIPRIIINRILKNNINFITQNCNYYRSECREFNWWNYILYWWLFNVNGWNNGWGNNWWWNNNQWCTAEQLLACVVADDYDACIANCTYNENLDVYSLITWNLTFAPWMHDVELFKAKLVSTNANWIEITNYEIDTENFNSWLFSNLRVYVDGIQYDWNMNSSDLVFNSNDSFNIPAWSFVYIKVVWNISDNVATNNPVRFKLIINTWRDMDTNNYINFYWLTTNGPNVSIMYPYFTLENNINNYNPNIILWNENTVRKFDIHQHIEDTNINQISIYYSWTTGLSYVISNACLESENLVITCLNSDLQNTNTWYLVFNNLSLNIIKDNQLNISLKLTAKNEFNLIWNNFEFSLDTWNIITSEENIWFWWNIQSEQIKIVWEIPEVTLSKDLEDILVTIQNISIYDLEIWEMKYRILCNVGNLSQNCVEWTALILDSINGIEVGTSWDFPWRITSQINQWYWLIGSNNNLIYNIHLDSNYVIESDDYTVYILGLKYRYQNGNNLTDWIEVQYDISL